MDADADVATMDADADVDETAPCVADGKSTLFWVIRVACLYSAFMLSYLPQPCTSLKAQKEKLDVGVAGDMRTWLKVMQYEGGKLARLE